MALQLSRYQRLQEQYKDASAADLRAELGVAALADPDVRLLVRDKDRAERQQRIDAVVDALRAAGVAFAEVRTTTFGFEVHREPIPLEPGLEAVKPSEDVRQVR